MSESACNNSNNGCVGDDESPGCGVPIADLLQSSDRCNGNSSTTTTSNADGTTSNHSSKKTGVCLPISDTQCIRLGAAADNSNCCYYAESPAPIPAETPDSEPRELVRKLAVEFVGTALLVMIVVASGISAERISDDVGIQLLINAVATIAGLYGLITIFGPVSGAHFNPCVSVVDVCYGDMTFHHLAGYVVAQITGGICGCLLANVQYAVPISLSDKERFGYELWISEVVATSTLILVIHGCIRTGFESSVPSVVSLWVGGGYFFTSSSIFANPAVTIGRMFTDTFAGINPVSAGVFICFQLIGAVVGYALSRLFYPSHPQSLRKGDNLYRRACVLELKDFYAKGAY